MNIGVKKLTLEYIPEIIKMIHTAIAHDFPPYSPKIIKSLYKIYDEKCFNKIVNSKYSIILGAFINNKLVGFLTIKDDFGGVAILEWLIVDKDYRNIGVGKTLLDTAEKWALENYFHYMYLYTETDKNVKYYKKRGYTHIGAHPNIWFGVKENILYKIIHKEPFDKMFDKYID